MKYILIAYEIFIFTLSDCMCYYVDGRKTSVRGKIIMREACIFNIQKFSIHDGPGIRTTVFFKGCPLRCKWCSNPESQTFGVQPERETPLSGRLYTMAEVLKICLDDRDFYLESGGGVTLSGGEVLGQPEFAAGLLQKLREEDVHTALETTGFAAPEVFWRVIREADLLLYDMKHYDSKKHRDGTGVDNEQILQNLKCAVAAEKPILIRIPVIPGYNNSPDDAKGFGTLLTELGLRRVQLLPFHQFGQKKYATLGMPYNLGHLKALHAEDLTEFQEVMQSIGMDCVF